MWRIVEEKGYSPETIRHEWSRVDVLKFNAILDMRISGKYADTGYQKLKEISGGS